MAEKAPVKVDEIDWEKSASDYCRRLPLEYWMHSIPQSAQEKIFAAALDQVHAKRPDIQPFGDLLIQYALPVGNGLTRMVKVVPDNMVILWATPIVAKTSYIIPKQPTKPFWVLEYLSKSNERKDYEESYVKYERELMVPYLTMFHPEKQELSHYRHDGENYIEVDPNEAGRLPLPELDIEIAIHDEYMRIWFRGNLMPMPAELQQKLEERTKERDDALNELERLRQELARLKGDQL